MNKNEKSYWVVIKTPNDEIRYVEVIGHAIVKDVDNGGEAVRIARKSRTMK